MCVRETPPHRLFPVTDSGKGPVLQPAFLPPLTSDCATASPAVRHRVTIESAFGDQGERNL
ncbi:hypothetical protein HanRHA438_Chr09g0394601 [Helianthus annuus]|nr:hypothetical protein HanRHA438_Chr09g0394601 [Helianthus annuus]